MKFERRGRYDTQNDLINRHFPEHDPVLFSFQVALLDHQILDLNSPTLFLSKKTLLLSYDDVVEVYDLENSQIYMSGGSPTFKVFSVFFSLMGKYDINEAENMERLRSSDTITKMSIDEPGVAPKDILLRKEQMIQKSFQTWAMMRIILNVKHGIHNDPRLFDMLNNNFILFNQRTIIYFSIISILYILLSWILRDRAPEGVGLSLDILYGLVTLIMVVWLYFSYEKILKQYQAVYKAYTMKVSEDNKQK